MQPITLTDEQRAFRAAIRQMAEERFAPRAAEIDATGEFPWDNFKDCVSMDLPGMAIPAGVRRVGSRPRHPRHHGRGTGPGVRFDQPDDGDQRIVLDADRELGQSMT